MGQSDGSAILETVKMSLFEELTFKERCEVKE